MAESDYTTSTYNIVTRIRTRRSATATYSFVVFTSYRVIRESSVSRPRPRSTTSEANATRSDGAPTIRLATSNIAFAPASGLIPERVCGTGAKALDQSVESLHKFACSETLRNFACRLCITCYKELQKKKINACKLRQSCPGGRRNRRSHPSRGYTKGARRWPRGRSNHTFHINNTTTIYIQARAG